MVPGDARRQDADTRKGAGGARGALAGGWLLPCFALLAASIALPSSSQSEDGVFEPEREPFRAQQAREQPPLLFPAAAPETALPDATASTAEPLDIDWRARWLSGPEDAAHVLAKLPTLRWPLVRAPKAVTRGAFPQWSGVMEKSWGWDVLFDDACGDIVGRPCQLRDWQAFLEKLAGLGPEAQLAAVNRQINQVSYREDSANWGEPDYWAAPGEFFANGGDCEDYAIAKYYSLRALGFAAEQMRIVVLQDLARRQPHAVLVVMHDGAELVLDNLNDVIVTWSELPAYRATYSVNELAYWLHNAVGAS